MTKSSNQTREAEATSKVGTLEYRGHTFTVPLERSEWTVDFLESLEEGKSVGIVRGALGTRQWRTVQEMALKLGEFDELASKVARAMGFGSTGESPASSA